ncbi:MAG: hypothetical protein V9G12_17815 [Microthrixaceae bacterium]
MATPSTSKKIQRVQQSGVTRRVGQRRPLGFPAAIVAIIVVGLVLVWFARDARINVDGDRPRANQDKWYEAYGLYICDSYQANPPAPAESNDISTRGATASSTCSRSPTRPWATTPRSASSSRRSG